MKVFSPSRSKLIKAEEASKFAVLPLTLEQRIHEAAVKSAANTNLNKVIVSNKQFLSHIKAYDDSFNLLHHGTLGKMALCIQPKAKTVCD